MKKIFITSIFCLLISVLFLQENKVLANTQKEYLEDHYNKAINSVQEEIFNTATEVESSLNVRNKALSEMAFSYGVQKGANFRQKEILQVLEKNKINLDKAYDFSFLLIEGQVAPPVIIGGEQYTNENKKATRIMQTYIIKTQPRFVSHPPNWREYLYMEYEDPKKLVFNKNLLPKNKEEEKLIKSEIAKGFLRGIEQADYLYTLNMNRLNRDFKGMMLFHRLVKRGIIAMPKIHRGDLGITIRGNELKIGETVFTVEEALFQDPKKWR